MSDLVIGVDVGTSSTKTLVMDESGAIVGSAVVAYPTIHGPGGRVEQEAGDWWNAVVTTVRAALEHQDANRVRALTVSAQAGCVVCADALGSPLGLARSWLDATALAAAGDFERRFGRHSLYELTGWRLGPSYCAAQIADLRSSEPERFGQTEYFLDTAAFINTRLTGRVVADQNSTGISQLLNVSAQCYAPEVLEAVGVPIGRLPELVRSGEAIGPLTPASAHALGLTESVLVVAGGHDQYCAALGAGALDEGTLMLSAGTAWVILGQSAEPIVDPSENFAFGAHILPGRWGQLGSLRNGGSSLEWIRRVVGGSGRPASFEQINSFAEQTAAGADGLFLLPHFGGTVPDWVDSSRGSLVGLDLAHEPRHLVRAALEGIAAEAASLVELCRALNPGIARTRMIGGAVRSPVWPQILADMLDMPIEVPQVSDAAPLGAAIVALAGDPSRLRATAQRLAGQFHQIEPGRDAVVYAELAPVRRAFADALAAVYSVNPTVPGRSHHGGA